MRFSKAALLVSAALLLTPYAQAQKRQNPKAPAALSAPLVERPASGERPIALDSASLAQTRRAFFHYVDSMRQEKGLAGMPAAQPEFMRIAQQTADRLIPATVSEIRAQGHYYGENATFSARMDYLQQYAAPGTSPSECIESHLASLNISDSAERSNQMYRAAWELFHSPEHLGIMSSPIPVSFSSGVGVQFKEIVDPDRPAFLPPSYQVTVVYIPSVMQNSASASLEPSAATPKP